MVVLIVFFFSSRRRHTRYWRDWSSDVCSSDLVPASADLGQHAPQGRQGRRAGAVPLDEGTRVREERADLDGRQVGEHGPSAGRELGGQPDADVGDQGRSEEHTSELQSRQYLVCRLLLEKNNPTSKTAST